VAVAEHQARAPAAAGIRVAIISVSDSRNLETDEGGSRIETAVRAAGFPVASRDLVRDELEVIRARVREIVGAGGAEVVLLTGGTGLSPRDRTVEAVAPLFEQRLDGFGELFRMLSFAEIGAAAMLSRATAGIVAGVAVFLMPGSPAGVQLALDKLILPEVAHLVGQLQRHHHHHARGGS